jgi:hypothetical protein
LDTASGDRLASEFLILPVQPALCGQHRGHKKAEQEGGKDKQSGKAGHAQADDRRVLSLAATRKPFQRVHRV